MKILLIAGHGAGDVGAVGNGFKEADKTREFVGILAPKLRSYATVDVRDTKRNAFVDAQKGLFSAKGYDYVLELHFNAFNGQAHGSECYVTSAEKGITVEQAIMKGVSKFFQLRDNDSIFDGVKRTNFLVIQTAKNQGVSGALLEMCFIDNASDMKIYEANKNKIADAIVDGIAVGFGLKKGTTAPQTQKPAPKPMTNIVQVAKDVIAGKYGDGEARKVNLKKAGYDYNKVQAEVNRLMGVSVPSRKSNDTIANEVINGLWGVGNDRKNRLTKAGYNYNTIQAIVNKKLS